MKSQSNKINISPLPKPGISAPINNIYWNTEQKVIVITEDKINLCLERYVKDIEKRKEWITPITLLIAIIVVLASADFRDYLINSELWRAIFIVFGVLCFIWLIYSIFNFVKSKKIQDIVDELKEQNSNK